MHSTPFDIEHDLAPIPFDPGICKMAERLKEAGLSWTPHVGCFVWDRDEHIKVPSPFPERIYFILNLGRFTELLGTIENIAEKLIWIPTWYQARELAEKYNIVKSDIMKIYGSDKISGPADELMDLYKLLLNMLHRKP